MGDVISGILDAAFILHRLKNPLIKITPIKADKTGIILPDDHRLAIKKQILLKELRRKASFFF